MQKPPKQNLNRSTKKWLKLLLSAIKKNSTIVIIAIIFFLIPLLIYLAESKEMIKDYGDGFWWTITTITTVGYGDIFPKTVPGKLIAVVVMLFGTIALESLRLLIFSILIDKKIKEKIQEALGIGSYEHEQNHIIICEYNPRVNQIVQELRNNPKTKKTPIILIADIEKNPINDDNFYFIKGSINPDNLKKANLAQANTVIILADHKLDIENRDYKAISACYNVKKINPEVYTILEISDEAHLETYKGVANEMIVSGKLTSLLISNAVINNNVSLVLFDILTYQYGSEIQKIRVSKDQIDHRFIEVFTDMKKNEGKTVIAIEIGEKKEIKTNPAFDYRLKADDYLIVIATEIDSSSKSKIK